MVYAKFCKYIGKDCLCVEQNWGSADKMRIWLTNHIQERNSAELHRLFGLESNFADEYRLKGYGEETDNPAALELLDARRFETLLVSFAHVEWRFKLARSSNTRGVVAQNVSVPLNLICHLPDLYTCFQLLILLPL